MAIYTARHLGCRSLCLLFALVVGPGLASAQELGASPAASAAVDATWHQRLRASYFGDRPIGRGDGILALDAPHRAADAALVPIEIQAHIPQTPERYIETVHLFVDENPVPLVGRFHFTPKSGRADLALRVRVDAYSAIRAVAQTNDGQLHMVSRFVKASGGCSAPASTDVESALARLGKMKLRMRDVRRQQPVHTWLNISHPNITGLQMDQLTRHYLPPHFVQAVEVRFNGERVLSAEMDISVSEDPSFRFYFVPEGPGELSITVRDNRDNTFEKAIEVQGGEAWTSAVAPS